MDEIIVHVKANISLSSLTDIWLSSSSISTFLLLYTHLHLPTMDQTIPQMTFTNGVSSSSNGNTLEPALSQAQMTNPLMQTPVQPQLEAQNGAQAISAGTE